MVKVQTLIDHYRQFYNYKEDRLLEDELAKQLKSQLITHCAKVIQAMVPELQEK
jgi:hypothetical protein